MTELKKYKLVNKADTALQLKEVLLISYYSKVMEKHRATNNRVILNLNKEK